MKYETPELTALTPAVSAIQGNGGSCKCLCTGPDNPVEAHHNELVVCYADWE